VGILLVVKIGAGHVNQPRTLILNRLHNFGMTVARRVDRDAGSEVEELVAIDIFDAAAPAALHGQRITARIAGTDDAFITFNHLPGQRPGKRSDQAWAELNPCGQLLPGEQRA